MLQLLFKCIELIVLDLKMVACCGYLVSLMLVVKK